MLKLVYFLLVVCFTAACKPNENQTTFYVDPDWIEVHFHKNMKTEELVDIRDRLVPMGVILKYLIIQRDSSKVINMLQIEVQDGKGKLARSRTEFLDEIPYGIRINRKDYTDEGFKIGPLYSKRPK
ncbi:MAG: hypothetical protein IPL31_07910 [Saprospiraceae bacterium]|nr:hypothetical protein [Saprospiraceae bacterium]